MRVRVYIRRKGEPSFRDLGSRDMGSVPAENDNVVINVKGETIQARVDRVRSFMASPHQPERDPEVYLESL
jgi:hypothetical protein